MLDVTCSKSTDGKRFYLAVFGSTPQLDAIAKALVQSPAMSSELEPLVTKILKAQESK